MMGTVRSPRVAGPLEVPEHVRARGSLDRIDYGDLFTLRTTVVATPEQWARGFFGDEPSARATFLWRGLLGLRLAAAAPDVVAGWRIGDRGVDWIRLAAESWFLSANILIGVGGGRVAVGTCVRYDNPVGGVVWPPLSAVHRRLVPGLLVGGESRLSRGSIVTQRM